VPEGATSITLYNMIASSGTLETLCLQFLILPFPSNRQIFTGIFSKIYVIHVHIKNVFASDWHTFKEMYFENKVAKQSGGVLDLSC